MSRPRLAMHQRQLVLIAAAVYRLARFLLAGNQRLQNKMAARTWDSSGDGNSRKPEKYPKEIANSLLTFQNSVNEIEQVLAPLKTASIGDVHCKLNALERAKLELVSAYAINSMFWMYLCTQGVNPREHPIKHELSRIQKYMNRVKEIVDKEKASHLDKGAAKRFVNAALFDASKDKEKQNSKRRATDALGAGPSKKR